MTGAELAGWIERTGWSRTEVARRFDLHPSNIKAMIHGRMSVDPLIGAYLRSVATAIERVPLPELADRR